MFIKVIYNDGDEMIVNPNCYIRLIYEYIRIKANVQDEVEIDLFDEKGTLKKIYEPPTWKSGLELLENTVTYYLALLKTDKNGKVTAVPGIDFTHPLYDIFVKKLEIYKSGIKLNKQGSKVNMLSSFNYSEKSSVESTAEGSSIVATHVKKKKRKKLNLSKSTNFPGFLDKNQRSKFFSIKELEDYKTTKITYNLKNIIN